MLINPLIQALRVSAAGFILLGSNPLAAQTAPRPNIVLILADDMGLPVPL